MAPAQHQAAADRGSREEIVIVDLESEAGADDAAAAAATMQRQDSLYAAATRAAGANHHGQDSWARTLRLAFQCVGILYGDIGTSPLFVYSSTFRDGVGHPDDLLGALSLIIYSFLLFTVIKYVYIALRANDDGDGGTFALYTLISRHAKVSLIPNQQVEEDDLVAKYNRDKPPATLRRAEWMKELLETNKAVKVSLFLITMLATAMVISDAILTPAISVLSAVGGLKEKATFLTTDEIVWITVGILVALFAIQRFGTDKVGYLFAPIILLWLLLIAAVGFYNLVKYDTGALRAFNMKYIIDYFRRNKKKGWASLGGILLCFTGTEALFADLGYFSIRSIQLSFGFGLVPSVLLAYIGQAAYLRVHPEDVANTFYRSTPISLFWPTFILALAASIIGSQAMISCAFATISHSQTLGCFPRVKILHTSRQYSGQLYIPEVNYLLCLGACLVTVGFRTTVIIGEAHGICVVLVMIVTTLLLTIVMLLVWKISVWWIVAFFLVFMSSESIYLSAILSRFAHGAYVPVAMSAVLMVVMVVWHYVHVNKYRFELEHSIPRDKVKELLERSDIQRVPGIGLFYTELVQGIPPVFRHLIEKIPSIHSVLIFVSMKHLPIPSVDMSERFLFRQVDREDYKVFQCVARYGYRDPFEEAKDFVDKLVEHLQYYIRDVNLYGLGCEPMMKQSFSYCSSRAESFGSHEKTKVKAVYAEEMLTPAESFSEHARQASGKNKLFTQFQGDKMNIVEMMKIQQEQQAVLEEMSKGVVYIFGESEVVARPHSSLIKKIAINYIYSFLRKNSRNGEKMLSIPRRQILKVGVSYEI
ncbi:Potassium transporter 27 [Zea mays]|uniref:Potassium transporter n=2 Tax=Zea mays TaxID=4577 RepID=W5U505_MAIZE|nr:Potassium transporter 27 [Zea mays]AHH35067.1 high-affinity potassium transporter [Zea mays]|eukprot:NP_001288536.1 potassium transporter 27-like [Zea mays]